MLERSPERPVVVHGMRAFLSPTETFIGNQIVTLKAYRPVVCCHHRLPTPGYENVKVFASQDFLPALPRLLDLLCYRWLRHLTRGTARALAERLMAEKARILHFHYLVDARYFLLLKQSTHLPALVSIYGYDVSSFPRTLAGYGKHYLQPVLQEMDCFLAMSHDMRRDLVELGCPEEKIVVHYCGTDTDRFWFPNRTYPEKETVHILMCGTLEIKKAQDRVLQALRLWDQRNGSGHTFHLTLMGDGPLRSRVEGLIRDYGWQDRVRILGHVPYHQQRLVDEYRRADIFTLPSVTVKGDKEGIPGTIIEAMACGLPVVSTCHAGIPEVISHGKNGLLVPEADLTAMAQALGRLIEDRALRERLGRAAARTAASDCRLLSRTPVLERIYDGLLAGRTLSQFADVQPKVER